MSARIQAALLAVIILSVAGLGACKSAPEPVAPLDNAAPLGLPSGGPSSVRSLRYNVPCYTAQGGATIVIGSGCTLDATSGTVLGATANDLNGGALALDADGDTILRAQVDDLTTLVLGAATGTLQVSTGSFRVGNGANGVTLNGEDFYVEGTSEFDGAAQFDGAVVNNSTTQLVGAVNLDGAVDLDGVITNAANLEHIGLPTWVTTAFTYTAAAGGTVTLATIGAGEAWIVHDVRVEVTSNFNATGDDATLTIGDGNDADGFCVLADAELQAADTEGTGWSAGWQCQVAATRGVYIDGTGGFVYDEASTETIDAFIDETSGETLAAGAATVHILYTRIQ